MAANSPLGPRFARENAPDSGITDGGFFRCAGIRGYQDSWWNDLAQRSAQTKWPALLYGGEEFAGGDGGAFFGGDGEHTAGAIGLELVLHLHGFDHPDALAVTDRVAGGGQHADYFAGHGAEDRLHGVAAGAGGLAGPAARVADFDFPAVALDGDDGPGRRFFDKGVIAAAIEEDRVAAGFGALDVGVYSVLLDGRSY